MSDTSSNRPHVIVVGGGFAGMAAVRALRKAPVDVTLVDRHVYHTFQPLLYQVATAGLNPGDITYFLRSARGKQKNVNFHMGAVSDVDATAQTITLDTGEQLSYDFLVLSGGVTTNYFGVPGAAEHAMAMYTRKQALAVRDKLFADLEAAAASGRSADDLRVVVVGGGATACEMAGAWPRCATDDARRHLPELDPAHVHIMLVEMGPHVLARRPEAARLRAAKQLLKRDIDLRLSTSSRRCARLVVDNDGEVVPASMVGVGDRCHRGRRGHQYGLPQGPGLAHRRGAGPAGRGLRQRLRRRGPRRDAGPAAAGWRSRRSRAASTWASRSRRC
jgi:NADH dehydrogenase